MFFKDTKQSAPLLDTDGSKKSKISKKDGKKDAIESDDEPMESGGNMLTSGSTNKQKADEIDFLARDFAIHKDFVGYFKTSALFGSNVKNVIDEAIYQVILARCQTLGMTDSKDKDNKEYLKGKPKAAAKEDKKKGSAAAESDTDEKKKCLLF